MELKTIRYFVAVAEELHFGRAARRLHISQPPLSRQVRLLEEELGSLLLRRTRRRVELTQSGETFLMHANLLLKQLEEARSAVRRADRGEVGRLVIGFFRGAMYSLLPEVLRAFRSRAPNVELVLREMETDDVPQCLSERQIDAGFLRPPVADAALQTELMLSEPVVAALPAGNPLCRKRQLRLEDLAGEPFVAYSASSMLGHNIMHACYQAGFSPRVVQEARHPETLIGFVRSGAGVALVSASHQARGASDIVFRKVIGRLPKAEIILAWREDNESPLLETFLDTARRARRLLRIRRGIRS